ncbi:MAG: virulence factor family protein [Rhodobacteraceae bacterium]|nr:virulence factor family protein [Paracoccaceae bacterium]
MVNGSRVLAWTSSARRVSGVRRSLRSRLLLALPFICLLLGGSIAVYDAWLAPTLNFLTLDRVALPATGVKGVVFLFSDAPGWGPREAEVSARLREAGLAVVGIDTPTYLRAMSRHPDRCGYMVSDLESVAQSLQRSAGSQTYAAPIVAGFGLGGGLALDMVDQTPEATIGGTVVMDPASAVPLKVELCTPSGYLTTSAGEIYALHGGHEPDPVSVLLSPGATDDTRDRVGSMSAASADVKVIARDAPTADSLSEAVMTMSAAATVSRKALPIKVLSAVPRRDAMAVILSGDGGWRDIDSSIARLMQADGVPVVGVDSLRYFWSRRTPAETARDLSGVIEKYRAAWNVKNVLLIGYSFGADVLPATYAALPEATRRHIRLVGLLGFSKLADWQITVAGWFGSHGSAAAAALPIPAALPPGKILCVLGREEPDSACHDIVALGAETLVTKGGHHFGGDYPQIERALLAAYDARRAKRDSVAALTPSPGAPNTAAEQHMTQ